MKITIYNANDTEQSDLDATVADLSKILEKGHQVTTFKLRELKLNYCNGCWACWVKTPGRCKIKDDMSEVYRSFIDSDLVIFAAQMRMGFPNALMKKVNDRLIPLVHPYIELVDNECHHRSRYEKYPYWGLLLQKEENGFDDDIELVSEIYKRTSLNIKSSLLFTCTSDQSVKTIADEINHI